jgi:hypothetical protein
LVKDGKVVKSCEVNELSDASRVRLKSYLSTSDGRIYKTPTEIARSSGSAWSAMRRLQGSLEVR